MSQYTNSVSISVNDSKTEVFLNFSQISVGADNKATSEPVSSLVMSGEMAQKLALLIQQGLDSTPSEQI